jgi:histidinol phosphatase-like enzyme
MILEACKDHNINPLMSIMAGDKLSDAQAASSSGIKLFVNSSQRGWVDNLKNIITLHS